MARSDHACKGAVCESALDGGIGGVHPQRYYKVFEFTVPRLVAPNGGPDKKGAELVCSISNARI